MKDGADDRSQFRTVAGFVNSCNQDSRSRRTEDRERNRTVDVVAAGKDLAGRVAVVVVVAARLAC